MYNRRLQTIEQLMADNLLFTVNPRTIEALNNKKNLPKNVLTELIMNDSNDEFQAIDIGNEKFKLIPTSENLNIFLYRGQNTYYEPCLSTIDRDYFSEEEKIINQLKKIEFVEFLKKHPIIEELSKF